MELLLVFIIDEIIHILTIGVEKHPYCIDYVMFNIVL